MDVNLETVDLLPKKIKMFQKADMGLFRITGFSLSFKNNKNTEDGVMMSIVMKRKIASEMLTTYFPSFLLMLITFATTFFKPFFFEAALSVNLTTMLVMTTIFISKMEGLPPTSESRMIDLWLILCQLVPFSQVVLITAMEHLREEETKSDVSEETKIVVLPTLQQGDEVFQEETLEVLTSPAETKGNVLHTMDILKTLGRFFVWNYTNCFCSEKKVLPGLVLVIAVIYFSAAAIFYSE